MTAVAAQPEPKRDVVLIDLSAIFRASYHAMAPDTDISGVVNVTLSGVRRCVSDNQSHVAICCDGKGNWRKALSPEYKAQREKQPADMYDLLDRVKARLVSDGYLLWECDGYEADDIIATATEAASSIGHTVTIASHDKDLLQLVCPSVRFLKTSTWDVMGPPQVVEKFGVPPFKVCEWLALTGDKSDNVAGCEGCGPKTAAELLTKFGTLAEVFDSVANAPVTEPYWRNKDGSPKKLRASLKASQDTVWLAKKLVTLKYDAPINFGEIFETREQKPITEDDEMTTTDAEFDDVPISRPPQRATQEALPIAAPTAAEAAARVAVAVVDAAKASTNAAAAPASATTELVPANGTSLVAKEAAREAMADFDGELQPTGMRGLWWLAKRAIESRSGKFKNENEALMVMLRGHDFGLTPAATLDIFHVIEGKPCPPASLLIARAKAHPDCEYFMCVEADDTHATWETKSKRNPKPSRVTFTVEQAIAAGLNKKNVWEKYREDLLVWRSGLRLVRREYPEALLGAYAAEEMDA